jgi:hypothetical protein
MNTKITAIREQLCPCHRDQFRIELWIGNAGPNGSKNAKVGSVIFQRHAVTNEELEPTLTFLMFERADLLDAKEIHAALGHAIKIQEAGWTCVGKISTFEEFENAKEEK